MKLLVALGGSVGNIPWCTAMCSVVVNVSDDYDSEADAFNQFIELRTKAWSVLMLTPGFNCSEGAMFQPSSGSRVLSITRLGKSECTCKSAPKGKVSGMLSQMSSGSDTSSQQPVSGGAVTEEEERQNLNMHNVQIMHSNLRDREEVEQERHDESMYYTYSAAIKRIFNRGYEGEKGTDMSDGDACELWGEMSVYEFAQSLRNKGNYEARANMVKYRRAYMESHGKTLEQCFENGNTPDASTIL